MICVVLFLNFVVVILVVVVLMIGAEVGLATHHIAGVIPTQLVQ